MLFGYLAYHSAKALSRDHLARVFWPEKQESQPESARRSLNVELNHIRKAIRQQTGLEQDLIVFEKKLLPLATRLSHPLRCGLRSKPYARKYSPSNARGNRCPTSSSSKPSKPIRAISWTIVRKMHSIG
jgi:hypothetical protein